MKSVIATVLAGILMSACATTYPITATSNPVGTKEGVACYENILGVIPLSTDGSIHTAAANGKIQKISSVDSEVFLTAVYNSTCTVVRGE